jgi:hypothetical protein
MWMKRREKAEKVIESRYEDQLKSYKHRVKELKGDKAHLQGRISAMDQRT